MKLTLILASLSIVLPTKAGQDAIFSTGFEPSFSVGGNITGLDALGESVEIFLNGVSQTTVMSDGSYTSTDVIEAGQVFDVTIDNNNCTVMNGSGVMPNNAVTNADINCPLAFTTVYDIKQGFVTGDVALQNMLVTACADSIGYNLQTVSIDPDFIGDDFSGIYVFDSSVDCMAIQIGDRVDINPGTVNVFFGETQLQNATYSVQSSGNPPPTPVITTTAALGGSVIHPLNGVIVEVQNVTVSNLDSPNFEYELDMSLTVSDRHYLTTPFPEVSETMTHVRGPLAYNLNINTIDPRNASDLGRSFKLVINELDYDQPAADDDEFLEIYNVGPGQADLSDLAIVLVNGDGSLYHSEPLASIGTLDAGEYLVVGDPNVTNSLPSGIANITLPSLITIQNGAPDGMALVNLAEEVVLDALSYEGEISNADVGFSNTVDLVEGNPLLVADTGVGSLSRTPNGQDTDDAASDWQFVTTVSPGLTNNTASPISLVINEVDYDQPGADTAEFVEIHNPSLFTIELSQVDLVIVNGSNNTEVNRIPLSGILGPNEYAVVANSGVVVPVGVLLFSIPGNTIQNGSPDGVALINNTDNTLIDALSYEGAITAAVITGFANPVSLVEGSPTSAVDSNTVPASIIRLSNSGDDAIDFVTSANPTPGEANTL